MISANIKQITERIRPRLMSSEYQAAELEELVKTHIAGDIWLTWYADLTGFYSRRMLCPAVLLWLR